MIHSITHKTRANTLIQGSPDLYNYVDGYVTIAEMTLDVSKQTELFCNITPIPNKIIKIVNQMNEPNEGAK